MNTMIYRGDTHTKALVLAQAAGKSLNEWATEALERAVAGEA
jgi:predicted HicB family RNase H-like nuclease